ncbi:DUF6655 family protein [Lacipirellula limnantheis]|uniref:Uncharacterized protein n=1 Tax=Lacipirellula limnantheis TaxID=2528024 RepID=A0A517U3I8_9BACT|nr:DUF6655 family protein [Lacipirellula limnantheis]QDT75186.1 hypothetical protein I41_43950 [Lacipirellula limnantheis]
MNARSPRSNLKSLALAMVACSAAIGCGTSRMSNTARTATEQLLISDAVDRTVQQINFKVLAGEAVFFDTAQMGDVVDKGYLISCMRQHLLASGCVMKEKREEATFIIEPRVGVIGTDSHDLMFGVPAFSVPQVVPGTPLPSSVPEIAFAKRRDQMGVAKIAVFAYRRETGEPVWQSGMAMNKSTANDIWLFGAGPFQKGTIYDETRFAGIVKKKELEEEDAKAAVEVEEEAVFAGAPAKAHQAKAEGVVQASAEAPVEAGGGPPVLPPPARPIAEAPKPAEAKEDPATTAG